MNKRFISYNKTQVFYFDTTFRPVYGWAKIARIIKVRILSNQFLTNFEDSLADNFWGFGWINRRFGKGLWHIELPHEKQKEFLCRSWAHISNRVYLSRLASGSISERNLTAGWLENILKWRITHRFTPEMEYREFTPENCQNFSGHEYWGAFTRETAATSVFREIYCIWPRNLPRTEITVSVIIMCSLKVIAFDNLPHLAGNLPRLREPGVIKSNILRERWWTRSGNRNWPWRTSQVQSKCRPQIRDKIFQCVTPAIREFDHKTKHKK